MVTHEETRLRILSALKTWAKHHPSPDRPVMFAQKPMTPHDVVVAVEQETALGQSLVNYLERSSKRFKVPPEEFIERAIRANS
jgi:hypothetical protein